jgi:tetratricopeptide (TPR) repeat protein
MIRSLDRVRIRWGLAVLALAVVLPAMTRAQDESWTDKEVILRMGGTLQGGTPAQPQPPSQWPPRVLETYKVRMFKGPWLWIESKVSSAKGWAQVDHLVTIERSVDVLTYELRARPRSAALYIERAQAHQLRREYDGAIADYNEALRLDPRLAQAHNVNLKLALAHNSRGMALYAQRPPDYDRAVADFTEAIKLGARDDSVYQNRGNAWYYKKEYDKAVADYTEAIRIDSQNAGAYNNRGRALHDKQEHDKAIADFNEALRIKPDSVMAYINRGHSWYRKQDYDKAIADFSEVIRINPKLARAYNNRGHAYASQQNYAKAIADYSVALKIDSKYALAHVNRGDAWRATRAYDKALADYKEAVALDPTNPESLIKQAQIWATCPVPTTRDGQRAIDAARKACEMAKWQNPTYLATLAAAYAEANQFDDAVKWQTAAQKLTSDADPQAKAQSSQTLALYQEKKPLRKD